MKGIKEIRDQSVQELTVLHQDLSKKIFALRNESAMMHKLEKPHLLKKYRKDRARVLTILQEKSQKGN